LLVKKRNGKVRFAFASKTTQSLPKANLNGSFIEDFIKINYHVTSIVLLM
jgi:hypothetical protein